MSQTRREFVKRLGGAALGSAAGMLWTRDVAGKDAPFIPLDQPGFAVDLGLLTGADNTITAYSGYCYSPLVDALLLFGGGHAATGEDVVLRFPVPTRAWSADYPATPKAARILANLTTGKFWQVPGQSPAIRPVARHTYTGNIWSSAINRLLLMGNNNGVGYGEIPETVGGNMAEYDPVSRTWADTGLPGAPWYYLYAEDPVSGYVLALTAQGVRVYDPRHRAWLTPAPVGGTVPYVQGGENLVYFPPTDKFYYFGLNANATANGPPTIEFAFDRQTLTPVYTGGAPKAMVTNWRPRASLGGSGTGFAYDAANQLIVGQMLKGLMYGFRPLGNGTGEWLQHPVPTTTETSSYCQAYVPGINAHLVTCVVQNVGKSTFAFRWDPAQASRVVDPRLATPAITVGGVPVASLQAACDAGGDIALSAGGLYGVPACATINRPVNIVGAGTVLDAPGIAGKGILIINADTRLVNLDLSGASVPDGNGAAIRHQGGNLLLDNVDIHDCQDGLLASPSSGTIVINDCDVYANGTGTGQTHGLYVGKIAQFVCTNSRFWATSIGHHIKTRAAMTTIYQCEIGTDFDGNESYNIDAPVGGDVTVDGCHLRQGPRTDNNVMLNYGGEPGPYAGGSLLVANCIFESTVPGGVGVRNLLPDVVAVVRNCAFIGVATPVAGNVHVSGCTLNGVPLPDSGGPSVEIHQPNPDFGAPRRSVGPQP